MSQSTTDRLRAALAARPRLVLRPSDLAGAFGLTEYRESAVLVPITLEPEDALIFTVRRGDLPTHAGQISFPGGKRDADDADPVATALRETEEELGVPAGVVEVVGILDDIPTPTGFIITPVIGILPSGLTLAPSAKEVAEVLHISVRELRLPTRHHHAGTRHFLGIDYEMHEYRAEPHTIWGATARITHQLLELL